MAVGVTLRRLVAGAYGAFQVSGGPDWMDTDRFDINARADGDPPLGDLVKMVRALLADRFKLVVHNETREMPVYALVQARTDGKFGPQMRRSETD